MPSLGNLFFKIGADVSEATKGIKKVGEELEKIKKINIFSAAIQGANAAISVFNSIAGAIRPMIDEYDKAAKAAAKLDKSLKGNSIAAKELITQANVLSTKRLFPSDVTVNAQSLLANLGFAKRGIKELIPVIQDFATAQGLDLATAVQLVGKSISTGSDSLKKYGISISDANSPVERHAEVMRKLTATYKGQAEAAAEAGAGPLQLLQQRFGAIKEIAGESLVKFVNELLPAAGKGIDGLADAMKELPNIASNIGIAFRTVYTWIDNSYQALLKLDAAIGGPLQALQKLIQKISGVEGPKRSGRTSTIGIQPGSDSIFDKDYKPPKPDPIKKLTEVKAKDKTLTEILTKAYDDLAKSTVDIDSSTEQYADSLLDLKNLKQQIYELEQKNLSIQEQISQKRIEISNIPQKAVKEVTSATDVTGIADKVDTTVIDDTTKKYTEFSGILDEIGSQFEGIATASADAFGLIAAQLITGQLAFKDLGKAALSAAREIVQAALAASIASIIKWAVSKIGLLGVGLAIAGVAVISGLFKSKVPKLAKGGLAFGPQLALVGDNPNAGRDPEVIAPLSRLQGLLRTEVFKMTDVLSTAFNQSLAAVQFNQPISPSLLQNIELRPQQNEINVVGRIDGTDIMLVVDRNTAFKKRRNG